MDLALNIIQRETAIFISANEIIDFWFEQTTPKLWWLKDAEFDALLTQRFKEQHHSALQSELYHYWSSMHRKALSLNYGINNYQPVGPLSAPQ
ncbi:DUF924 family protein [Shewanella ulleungensis]|uniref:DUF924 family protein n=1 Tax=Shewanella ulleungensis TaxID=2282699 RepID=UPI003D79D9A7